MTFRSKTATTLSLLLLVSALAIGCSGGSSSPTSPVSTLPQASGLSQSTADALRLAIDDEHKARATYDAVMDKFGEIRPFDRIRGAEEAHVRALVVLFDRYSLAVPADAWTGKVESPESIREACATGVEAELANIALYDELFAMVNEPDVIDVFNWLRSASLDRHLPAFRACS